MKYCRDDYIRFNDEYDVLLLNKEDWKVMLFICYVKDKGMQFMVCKDHDHGTKFAYVHHITLSIIYTFFCFNNLTNH